MQVPPKRRGPLTWLAARTRRFLIAIPGKPLTAVPGIAAGAVATFVTPIVAAVLQPHFGDLSDPVVFTFGSWERVEARRHEFTVMVAAVWIGVAAAAFLALRLARKPDPTNPADPTPDDI